MGIKDFYKYIKLKYPDCFTWVNYSQIKYQKLAIDMMNLLYIHKARSETEWLKITLEFLLTLREMHIHPICVFDGQSHPLKQNTVQKRKSDRDKCKIKVELLKKSIEIYKANNTINEDLQNFLESKPEFVSKLTAQPLLNRINDYMEKQQKNYNLHFRSSEINNLKEIIQNLGICVLTAEHDGEALCSYLSALGCVDIVLSNDSDVFFFGCKKALVNFTNAGGYLLDFDDLLDKLKISKEQFIDFCMLCGTDFNVPIKGIGFCKAYNLICEYNSIKNTNLPLYNQLDHNLLNIIKQMSKPPDFTTQLEVFFSRPINKFIIGNILEKNNIKLDLKNFEFAYSLVEVEN